MPRFFASSATAFFPAWLVIPVNVPLRTITPSPRYGAVGESCSVASRVATRPGAPPPASAEMTSGMGMPNFFANAKSRSSCAGTAMIAPVPYVART